MVRTIVIALLLLSLAVPPPAPISATPRTTITLTHDVHGATVVVQRAPGTAGLAGVRVAPGAVVETIEGLIGCWPDPDGAQRCYVLGVSVTTNSATMRVTMPDACLAPVAVIDRDPSTQVRTLPGGCVYLPLVGA